MGFTVQEISGNGNAPSILDLSGCYTMTGFIMESDGFQTFILSGLNNLQYFNYQDDGSLFTHIDFSGLTGLEHTKAHIQRQ